MTTAPFCSMETACAWRGKFFIPRGLIFRFLGHLSFSFKFIVLMIWRGSISPQGFTPRCSWGKGWRCGLLQPPCGYSGLRYEWVSTVLCKILSPTTCFFSCQTADGVFMSNHAEREEYVQEDAGIIFVGSTNRIGMIGWNYGQVKGS